MRMHDQPDGTLVLTHDSTGLSRVFAALAAVILAALGYEYLLAAPSSDRAIGLLIGAGTCAVMSVVFRERAYVVVNRATRSIAWTRTWAFQHRTGSLAFDEIASIMAERQLGDEGLPSRRLVLRTKDGKTVPLTMTYRPDTGDAMLKAAERIRTMMAGEAADSPVASVRALIDAGRVIEAITLLRDTERLSLSEAKRRVDALRSKL